MENRTFVANHRDFLERDDGSTTFEQNEILEEVKCFLTDLYRHRDIAEVDLTEVLTDTPVLTNEDSESIEGVQMKIASLLRGRLHTLKLIPLSNI